VRLQVSSWEPNLKPGEVIQSLVEVGRVFQLLRKNSDRLDVKQDPIITDISLHRSKSRLTNRNRKRNRV
jgi:hypothetical protein